MYKASVLILAILLSGQALAQNATVELEALNSEDQIVDSFFELKQRGETVESGSNYLSENVTAYENYTLRQEYDLGHDSVNVTLYDLNITEDISPSIRLSNYTDYPFLRQNDTVFALEDSNMDYSSAEISHPRSESPENILYCTEFSFSETYCQDWRVDQVNDYESTLEQDKFRFNTTSFSAYTVGEATPRLELQNIAIYNITGLSSSEKKSEGRIIDQGLNKTFQITQSADTASLRYDFNLTNTGTANWTLESEDQLKHEGVDTEWSTDQIWYNLSGEITGGSFSSGTVFWDASNGGTLTTKGQDSSMNASYTVDTLLESSKTYDQNFLVNDTSENVYDQDFHVLEAQRAGKIDVDLLNPPNQTLLPQNETFYMTANVTCNEGECGQVNGTPRYNGSEGQKIIPSDGRPFRVESVNRDGCNLNDTQECTLNWTVNATADTETYHLLDVNVSSEFSNEDTASEGHEVEVDLLVLLSLSWDTLDFGFLDPGLEDRPAEGNDALAYNVTVPDDSKPVDDLWIKGTDLISEENPDYSIGITNVSYALQNDIEDTNTIFSEYTNVTSDIKPGTVLNTFYWIDVPFGMTESGYNGTLTFKANVTE